MGIRRGLNRAQFYMGLFSHNTDQLSLLMQNKFIERSTLVEFKKGSVLTERGVPGCELLLVSSGVLGIWDKNGADGDLRLIYPAWRNSVLNIADVFSGFANYQVTALARSNVYVLNEAAVFDLWRDRQFVEWLLFGLSRNQSVLNAINVATRFKSVPDRILALVQVAYFHHNGAWPVQAFEMEWPIRGSDFSEMLGISRPYLHSTLVELELAGKLKIIEGKAFCDNV
jgi:CRP-like cAMP-binding protein